MELDDFRRQWRQQTTVVDTTASVNSRKHLGLMEKMYRNAQWEMALTVVTALGLLIFVALAKLPMHRLWSAIMLLLTGTMLFYYGQKLALLRRMSFYDSNSHHHVQTQYRGLRKMLRFYYQITLATGPVILLAMVGYQIGSELAQPAPFRWERVAGMGLFVLIFGALVQLAAKYGTRWYLQRLYGRHLDQLEAALRELEAPE